MARRRASGPGTSGARRPGRPAAGPEPDRLARCQRPDPTSCWKAGAYIPSTYCLTMRRAEKRVATLDTDLALARERLTSELRSIFQSDPLVPMIPGDHDPRYPVRFRVDEIPGLALVASREA